jgi:nitrile hydratase subunit beta
MADMGGRREFFGPIAREEDEPPFHAPWEARVFGVTLVTLGAVGANAESARYAMNRLSREAYLSNYYRRWLGGLELQLAERGLLAPGELEARLAHRPRGPFHRPGLLARLRAAVITRLFRLTLRARLPKWVAASVLPVALGTVRPTRRKPRFAVGDRVRVRNHQPPAHTRQPGYVTGKPGVIAAHLGATLLPDAFAVGRREPPQHLYTVVFDGRDLWGEEAEPGTEVLVDLYDGYLEAV